MIFKLFLAALIFGVFVSCSEKDKKTIGNPSGFSPAGSEFTLTPNLSAAALSALVSAQGFSAKGEDLFFQDPEILEILRSLSEGKPVSAMEIGTSESFEWIFLNKGDLQFRLSVEGGNTMMEAWKVNPLVYSRLFSQGARVDTMNRSATGIANYVYRSDCSRTILRSIFDLVRENSVLDNGLGNPCEGLRFYREHETPELVNQLRKMEKLDVNKRPLRPQLEIFYENL
jgi:hypothetical protein